MGYTDVEYKFKSIGKNVHIGRYVYFRYPQEIEIGDNVIIDDFCYFTTKVKIGNYVHIGPSCSIIGGINSTFTMEDFCGISSGCRIICSSDDYLGSGLTNPTIPKKYRANIVNGNIIMKKHSLLGTNCVVHPNVTLNEGAVCGSMALVNKDLEQWSVNIGIPCKKIKDREREKILDFEKKIMLEQ